MIKRTNVKETIFGGTPLTATFSGSKNFVQTFKDKSLEQSTIKLNDSKEMLHNLKDGIDGFFAKNGFELFDVTANLPLSAFFAYESMPFRYGGGFIEQVSAFRLNYQLAEGRLAGGLTNARQVTDVAEQKITVPAYVIQLAVGVGELELMKNNHIGYDIFGHRVEALRLSYQREIELFTFLGNLGVNGITDSDADFRGGLLNFGDDIALNRFYGKDWESSTDIDDIIEAVIGLYDELEMVAQWDTGKKPNTLKVPTDIYKTLLKPAVVGNTPLAVSNLEYLRTQLEMRSGQRFVIEHLPYIAKSITAEKTVAGIVENGANNLGMMVMYHNGDAVGRMNVTMPLTGGMIYPQDGELRQNYNAIVTPPLVVYPIFGYLHNGTDPQA